MPASRRYYEKKVQQEASDIRLGHGLGGAARLTTDVEKLTPDNTETLGLNIWLQGPMTVQRPLQKTAAA